MMRNNNTVAELQNYESIADRYYQLSIQDKLGPRDIDEMDSILEMAIGDRHLEFFLNEVDHMVAHRLNLIDDDYIQSQQQDLEKRLFLKKFSEQISKVIQSKLRGFGFYQGNVDGFYGKETKQSLQVATKKVQKHLKQERIYGGGIDGNCNLELEHAIHHYKANLHKDRLSATENDILELSTVVCAQIPDFSDPEPVATTETDGNANFLEQQQILDQSQAWRKWNPKLIYLGCSLLGVLAILTAKNICQPIFVAQGEKTNLYSPSSEIQHTAYKEGNYGAQLMTSPYDHTKNSLYLNRYTSQSHKASDQSVNKNWFKAKAMTLRIDQIPIIEQKDREAKSIKQLLTEAIQFSSNAFQENLLQKHIVSKDIHNENK